MDKLILADALPINYMPPVKFLQKDFFDLLKYSVVLLSPKAKIGEARKEVGRKLNEFLQVTSNLS